MRVNSIQQSQYAPKAKTFRSLHREVTHKKMFGTSKLSHRNDTSFFRDGEFWSELTSFIINKYKDKSKVNVYSYGCSDGSEAYSFVMSMITNLGENAKKFFPVIAKDFDSYVIKKAKSRDWYFIEDSERANINVHTNSRYNQFFKEIDYNYAYVTDELYNNVKFSVGDINDDYKNIEPNNSIIFVRNFWPYLPDDISRENLVSNLYDRLKPGSLVIIGQFDRLGTCFGIDNLLKTKGFKTTPVDFVYEKVDKNI